MTNQIASAPNSDQISEQTQAVLTKSFSSAADLAERYPQYSDQIIEAARQAFLDGDQKSYAAAGAVLVFFAFPRHDEEKQLLAQYASIDAGRSKTSDQEAG